MLHYIADLHRADLHILPHFPASHTGTVKYTLSKNGPSCVNVLIGLRGDPPQPQHQRALRLLHVQEPVPRSRGLLRHALGLAPTPRGQLLHKLHNLLLRRKEARDLSNFVRLQLRLFSLFLSGSGRSSRAS